MIIGCQAFSEKISKNLQKRQESWGFVIICKFFLAVANISCGNTEICDTIYQCGRIPINLNRVGLE
jgi:hypothetical protein